MFGNPGTVEQGFLDALSEFPRMKYILTLQEFIAVMAADGYARARKRPALVQLHSSPGIGKPLARSTRLNVVIRPWSSSAPMQG